MKRINLIVIQILLWGLIFLLLLVYNVRGERPVLGFISSVINIIIYSTTIYTNSLFLMPRFLPKRQFAEYAIYSVLTIIGLVLLKTTPEYFIHHRIFGVDHFYDFRPAHLAVAFMSVFLCFIIGGLLHVSLDYLQLIKKQEQLKNLHLSAELNLLKSQVQPHFLFNTLNNIYSLAYIRSEKTAEVVAKLSDIMRYFVEQAPKERVPLTVEIDFLQNYIALEMIRILHPVQYDFSVQVQQQDLPVPPMLFTPFVENVFKHGIDKKSKHNMLKICLVQKESYLYFTIKNKIFPNKTERQGSGTGLDNIRKRLDILYGNEYELDIDNNEIFYTVNLKFPI
ncbi:MAG: sensor histidine kinase [Saprospiraceae bacterium]